MIAKYTNFGSTINVYEAVSNYLSLGYNKVMNKLWVKILLTIVAVALISTGIYFYVSRNTKPVGSSPDKILISDKPFLDAQVISNEKEQISGESTLVISKISVSTPIILNVDGNNKETYMRALENGVAHLKNSALPGNKGNAVIFGHSSYYADKPGNYKTIFATLDKLETNDKIEIKSGSITYSYTVTSKTIVKPTDVSVVAQDPTKSELTLLTCWPINTTEKRMVIKATLSK